MTLGEEREYLENELKSYRYIVNQVYKYKQIIADSMVAKYGISSPCVKDIIYENASDPYHCKYNELDENIKEAVHKMLPWDERKDWIEERLSRIDFPNPLNAKEKSFEYRAITYRYIIKPSATYEQISIWLPCHVNSVKNIIDRAFEKMLN